MSEFLGQFVSETGAITIQSAPYLLLGFTLAGLLHAWLPIGTVARWLGGDSWRNVLYAAALGAPLPLCSCSVVPVSAQLRKAGASRGATAAFLISAPETGVDSITLTYGLLDPLITIARPIAAILSAFAGGMTQIWLNPEAPAGSDRSDAVQPSAAASSQASASASASGCGCCCGRKEASAPSDPGSAAGKPLSGESGAGFGGRLIEGLSYGWFKLVEDLAPYLVVGLLAAGFCGALFSRFAPLQQALGSPWAPWIMLAAGIPIYVCASSATPLVAVLISQGLSAGAGLTFLMSGPATNAASLVVLQKILGRKGVALYLVVIAACALGAGYLLDWIYSVSGIRAAAQVRPGVHAHSGIHAWAALATLAFLVLLSRGLYRGFAGRIRLQMLKHRPCAAM